MDIKALLSQMTGDKPPWWRPGDDDLPLVPRPMIEPPGLAGLQPRFSGEIAKPTGEKPYGNFSIGLQYGRNF